VRLALLILIPCFLRAQELQKIAGRVIDSASKAPIANATVALQSGDARQMVLTDGLGTFTFIDVPPGSYTLNAQRFGYDPHSSSPLPFNLEPGGPPKPFEFVLHAAAHLTGIVTGESSTPIPNATIHLIRREVREGEAVLLPMGSTGNDIGEYRVPDVPAGRYLICASAYTSPYKQYRRLVYPLTCFPGVSNPDSAQWVDVQSGAELQVDLQLALVHAIRVTGMTSSAGDHVGFSIQDLDRRYPLPGVPVNWENRSGTFTIPALAPGEYVLSASEVRNGENYSASRVLHASTEDITGIDVDLSASPALTGSATFEGEAPSGKDPPVISADGQTLHLYAPAGGDFRMPLPPPGSYRLLAQPPPGYYLKSAAMGGRSILDRRITITSDSVPHPLEIRFAKGGGELKLVFEQEDRAKLKAVKPVLLRRAAEGNGYLPSGSPMPVTNMDFRIQNVAPGDYVLFIVADDPNQEYMDPVWLTDHESAAIPVSIQDGQTTTITVKL
jgi:hypothetical protein